MSSLDQTTGTLEESGDGYAIDAPEIWAQGRTLYGGITAALSHAAARRKFGETGPLRSAQFSFIGPAAGRLQFLPVLLRQGRSSSVIAVDCHNEESIAARAMFVFGGARESAVEHDLTPRLDVPPPDACEPFHLTSRALPGFVSRFEFRLAGGARGFSRDERPEYLVWVRLRDGDAADPVTTLLALADALPCAAMVHFPRPAPLSTMTWAVDFHQPLADEGGWRLIRSTSEHAADGYSLQDMRIYSASGQPLISARQVVAIFV